MISLAEYKEELDLMKQQYGQEEELYPYIYMILRETGMTRKNSVRSMAGARCARNVEGRELLMGYAAFPDIAILDKKFRQEEEYNYEAEIDRLYCCVEAKKLGAKLLKIKGKIQIEEENTFCIKNENGESFDLLKKNGKASDYGELIGELLWYGRVIYTNGKQWKYLEIEGYHNEEDEKNSLAKLRKELYNTCVKPKDKKNGNSEGNCVDKHVWCKEISDRKIEFTVKETTLINIDDNTTESDWKDFKTTLRNISKKWNKK